MNRRALIAAVGQPWMRDLAFGSHVVTYLQTQMQHDDLDVHDLSFSPLAAADIIEDGRYTAAVFITATNAGRRRGEIYERHVEAPATSREELHARIGDCITGCVSLESLLILCDFRGILPGRSAIIEIEPEDEGWGPELSASADLLVAPAATRALERIDEFRGANGCGR